MVAFCPVLGLVGGAHGAGETPRGVAESSAADADPVFHEQPEQCQCNVRPVHPCWWGSTIAARNSNPADAVAATPHKKEKAT